MSRYIIWLLLAGCLLACGCSTAKDVGRTLGDLAKVHDELVKKFGDKDVNLRINGGQNRSSIAVTYVNSPLNDKTTEDRAKRAQETAAIVKQHYPSIKNVSEIWVGFMRVTTTFGIFHRSEVVDVHGFDNKARVLRDPGVAPEEEPQNQPILRYSANQNNTDISCSVIQLEGTAENGVTLLPHFSVAGDATKVTPKPPAEVSLDFAAFSQKPKFPNVTKIVFLTNNKVTYQTEGQFSTSKIGGDMYSEFLYLKLPTAAFLNISSGSIVKIKLNDHEYTLTEPQVRQIQVMADYIRNSRNT